jgi:phenylacetate-coenzyme A ligase PaaK-like adenylate-forming protein
MRDEHGFYKGPSGVAAFDQQHSAALETLREATAFMVVVAEPDANGAMQTRVLAASKAGELAAMQALDEDDAA